MTFEIDFEYQEVQFKATVTTSGNDYLVNLSQPAHYEAAQTLVFTRHEDGTMKYDRNPSDDTSFMPAVEKAIQNYLQSKGQ